MFSLSRRTSTAQRA